VCMHVCMTNKVILILKFMLSPLPSGGMACHTTTRNTYALDECIKLAVLDQLLKMVTF